MIAEVDYAGIAAVITSVAVLASVFMGYRKLKPMHQQIQQIDAAVNGKPPGATTMVSQVQDLHDKGFPVPPAEPNGAALLPLVRFLVEAEKNRGK